MRDKLVHFVFLLLICTSCSKDKTEHPLPCSTNPSFDLEIQNIFTNNCYGCHQTGNANNGIILDDFSTIKLNIDNSMEQIQNGTMPPTGMLSDSLIYLLNCWVANGALNN
jgi:hypothetical protein